MTEPTTAKVAISVATKILEQAERQGWVERLLDLVTRKPRILVLGSTGTGKTNFLASLKKDIPSIVGRMNRTTVAEKYKLKLDEHPFVFIDTPGEMTEPAKRERAIAVIEAHKKPVTGVIHVVSYGYHEHRTGDRDEALGENRMAKPIWLEQHQNLELGILAENVSRLQASWLLTVINKADLWWSNLSDVRGFYENPGAYQTIVASAFGIHHRYISEYCSVIKRFWDEGSVDGHFDDVTRIELRGLLIKTILAASAGCQ